MQKVKKNPLPMKRNQPKLPDMARALTSTPTIHVPPMPIPDAGPAPPLPQFVPQHFPPMIDSVDSVKNLLNHLRRVRDSQAYKSEGAHNFRELTMKQFGDRIGIWLDEML